MFSFVESVVETFLGKGGKKERKKKLSHGIWQFASITIPEK